MIQTYIRPLWNKILCIIVSYIISNIVLFVILYSSIGLLNGDPNVIAIGTVFGDVPHWFIFMVASQVFDPFICYFSIYPLLFKYKYQREYEKKLIPFYQDSNQPMIEAKKYAKLEPIWKENYIFKSRLELSEIGYFCGSRALARVFDINTNVTYYMFATRWKPNDGEYMTGSFSFDTNWTISNIYKVD